MLAACALPGFIVFLVPFAGVTQNRYERDCSNNIDRDGNLIECIKRIHASEMMITVVDVESIYIMCVRLLLQDSVCVCVY